MSATIILMLLVLVLVGLIIGGSFFAYNRHLDRVARGEERDRHTAIPEPNETARGISNVAFMVMGMVCVVMLTTVTGQLRAMQDTVDDLTEIQSEMNARIAELTDELRENESLITDFDMKTLNPDYEKLVTDVVCSVKLKEYTEDTAVALVVNGKEVPMSMSMPGTFSGQFTAGMFDKYDFCTLAVTKGDVTETREIYDCPSNLVMDLFPLPGFGYTMSTSSMFGKTDYEGTFDVQVDHTEDIEYVSVTFMADGVDVGTTDITEAVLAGNEIPIPEGIDFREYLGMRLEIATREGFTVSDMEAVIFKDSVRDEELYKLRIYDPAGNTVWTEQDER